jgi:hypothetical protein
MVNEMRTFFCLILFVLITGCSKGQFYPPSGTNKFPSEKEVRAFLIVGLDKQIVIKRYGEPLLKEPGPNGVETYYYNQPPYRASKDENFVYGGFQIYFVNNKVVGFDIIHKDVRTMPE